MKNENGSSELLQYVFLVVCYQNIIAVYANHDDACLCQRDLISRNRPADVICKPIVYPLNH